MTAQGAAEESVWQHARMMGRRSEPEKCGQGEQGALLTAALPVTVSAKFFI